jgi:hypothetical protein
MPSGRLRVLCRAAAIAMFCSLTLVFGHGVAPAPALLVLIGCALYGCESMYGQNGVIRYVLVPMAVQVGIVVGMTALALALRDAFKSRFGSKDETKAPE